MDLDLDILAQHGRPPKPDNFAIEREMTEADVAMLAQTPRAVPSVKRVTERHRTLARLLASGISPGEAALMVGYTPARVYMLKDDKLFQDLVQKYSAERDLAFDEVHERMAGLSREALAELTERLEQKPEGFQNADLLEIITKMADRTGHGPTTFQQNLNVNVDLADRLEAARQRARSAANGETIDATPVAAE